MKKVLVIGANDLGSAVAWTLARAGYAVVLHDRSRPGHARRRNSFADALYDGEASIRGVVARLCSAPQQLTRDLGAGQVLTTDAAIDTVLDAVEPDAIIDASNRTLPDRRVWRHRVGLSVGIGPGFAAERDVDLAVETLWGERLGRVIRNGATEERRSLLIGARQHKWPVKADREGTFEAVCAIGERVDSGQLLGRLAGSSVFAPHAGWLRGVSRTGARLLPGERVAEIDIRRDRALADDWSERTTRVAQAVLELLDQRQREARGVEWRKRAHGPLTAGVGVGTLGGLLGLGGAEFRLPLLAGPFGLGVRDAITINIAVSLVTVCASLSFRLPDSIGRIEAGELTAVLALLAGSLAGAAYGSGLGARMDPHALNRAVGVLLLGLSGVMAAHGLTGNGGGAGDTLAGPWAYPVAMLAGFGIGIVSSMLGVAGGELLIPTFVVVFGTDVKLAGTLALMVSLPTLAVSVLRYRAGGRLGIVRVEARFVVWMALGSIVGAWIGSRLAGAAPHGAISVVLALVLAASAFTTFLHPRAR